ncbi:MAG TPA: PDDEXK nuclease domain-containing protein [Methylococcaceae bacterium]|nr:PDDEXK nuclease domain-containing protein [Methylococcaceae bacterium]
MSKAPDDSEAKFSVAAPAVDLVDDIHRLITEARTNAATAVNASLTLLYWRVGQRIRQDVLSEKRARYGEQIVSSLSRQLAAEHGPGFSEKNLQRMIQFAEVFPDERIVVSLIRHLSWTHFIALIPLKQPLQREFYAEMCRLERWSVRTLRQKIDGMLYERTALSKKPEATVGAELEALRDSDRMSPDLVFRDPYVLDFLGLAGAYSERDLEAAILRDIESFLIELGGGFCFVARQKRMVIDGDDHYLDLLFYHRDLRRLVAVELKLGKFKAADKGQMELYLRWLAKHDAKPGEEAPLGLILCADGGEESIELLQLDRASIRVAQYLTELPPRDVLAHRLHEAIARTRARLENRAEGET